MLHTLTKSLAGLLLAALVVFAVPTNQVTATPISPQLDQGLPILLSHSLDSLDYSTQQEPAPPWYHNRTLLVALLTFAGLAGAFTVTYATDAQGSLGTVPPTAVQAGISDIIGVVLNCADTDTAQLITHNWGLSTADLTALFPIITWYRTDTTGTVLNTISFQLTNSVAITFTKTNLAGAGGTFNIVLMRPHTLIR